MASHRIKPFVAGMCSLAVIGCATQELRAPDGSTLLIRDVTVIDTKDGDTRNRQDVYISGERIASVRPTRSDEVPPGIQVVDGHGKFLIPGLWDMHTHWSDETSLPLFTLNGVTGIRQMFGYTGMYAWRAKGIEGTPAAPRMHLGSPLVDGKPPTTPSSLEVASPEEARAVVRLIADSAADFLKVYDKLPKPAYLALIDEARRLGVRAEGHVPVAVSWQEAADLGGQRSFEHFQSMPIWTASNSRELHPRWLEYNKGVRYVTGITAAQRIENAAIHHEAYDHYDPARFAALAASLRANQVWQTPTCVLWSARLMKLDPASGTDPRMKRVPRWMKDFWAGWWPKDEGVVKADFAVNARRIDYCLDRTRDMHAAGVPLLAGTDVIMPYVFAGTGLHDELKLMVEAGLPPLAALQSATYNVGRFLERDEIGVIKSGALADLVLLDADPLQDIANVGRIHGIAAGGRWIGPEAREAGLKKIERLLAAPAASVKMIEVLKQDGLDAALREYPKLCPASPEQMDCTAYNIALEVSTALAQGKEKGRMAEFAGWVVVHLADDAEAQFWAAEYYEGKKDLGQVRKLVERILRMAPGDPLTLQMQRRLAQ